MDSEQAGNQESQESPEPEPLRRPRKIWRDNFEAMTLALIVAVLLKYFAIEAYKIPSGSMQPTLLGWEDRRGGGLFDRVLVDKLSFHYRDPERFEVVVFQFPLDRSKHFVKRLVGMPGDHLRIHRGDLWLQLPDEDGQLTWRILRRPAGVQEEHWFDIPTAGLWAFDLAPNWTADGDTLTASGPGEATFPGLAPSIRDDAVHGYAPAVLKRMGRPTRRGGQHTVGDLRLAARVNAAPGCTMVRFVIEEGGRRHVAEIPGPAAAPGAALRLTSPNLPPRTSTPGESSGALVAGRPTAVRLWNLDDRLSLEVDGELVFEQDIEPARRGDTKVQLITEGGGARFTELHLERDLYYDTDSGRINTWEIPEGHYVVLGDNTVDSADSRAWELTTVHSMEGEFEGKISGQRRPDQNPSNLIGTEHFDDVVFTDQWGERRTFRSTRVHASTAPTPFVPRHLMRGRALSVFWPWKPIDGIWRVKWVR